MHFRSSLSLALLAITFLGGRARAFTDTVIADATFVDTDWTHSIVFSIHNAKLGPMTQEATGGNPGSFQHGQHHTVGTNSAIYDGHVFVGGASYDPSTQGAIASIDIQYDHIDLPGHTGPTPNGILVTQGGRTYIRVVNSSYTPSWTTHSLTGLVASDPNWFDVSATGLIAGHPDYSTAGGPMQFGYYTYTTSGSLGQDLTRNWGIDNFQVTVHATDLVSTSFCAGDGITIACPCANSGSPGRGCNNSVGSGGSLLGGIGTVVPDTVVLIASGELPSALSILLQGDSLLSSPLAFGDGVRCFGGVMKRLFMRNASSGVVSMPGPGEIPITARSAILGDPIAHGTVRYYLVYYRDPNLTFCPIPTGNTFNASQSISIAW